MSKRTSTHTHSAPGLKTLLTAAAIAATLAGWAGLAGQAEQPAAAPIEIAAPVQPRTVAEPNAAPAVQPSTRPAPVTVTQSSR
jgi:hypothetical protein